MWVLYFCVYFLLNWFKCYVDECYFEVDLWLVFVLCYEWLFVWDLVDLGVMFIVLVDVDCLYCLL